jgi:hypothetical protein
MSNWTNVTPFPSQALYPSLYPLGQKRGQKEYAIANAEFM